jgi:putative RNA 2'-phosphotransferase
MTRDNIRTSKFLSLVLRHQPESIGLALDANGWADIDALIAARQARTASLSPAS